MQIAGTEESIFDKTEENPEELSISDLTNKGKEVENPKKEEPKKETKKSDDDTTSDEFANGIAKDLEDTKT